MKVDAFPRWSDPVGDGAYLLRKLLIDEAVL